MMCRVMAALLVAVVLVLGCTIRIGSTGGLGGADGEGAGGRDEGSSGGDGGAAVGPTDEEIQQGEQAYATLEPAELALASSKAGHVTCALAGALDAGMEAQGIDPEALDMDALVALLEEYGPSAAVQAEEWLAAVDPSTLPFVTKPKFECGSQGCAYTGKCQSPFYEPGVDHLCFVDDCGPAKCSTCADWVNEILRNIAYSTWCSYVCVQTNTSPPKVVAVGAGFVSKFLNKFGGPYCVAHH